MRARAGYRPRAAARGVRGRTYTIGVLLDNVRNAFFADVLDGISEELRQSEYTVLIGAAGFGPEEQARTIRAMVDRQVDGLILIAPGTPRAEVLATAASTPKTSAPTWWWITWSRSDAVTSPSSRPRVPRPASGSACRRSC
ncbi:hypothetical protein [Streptomyces sp. ISL-96]|uniref:hypothetical protein n=1 Tax=Streptomyces sp. ISL-96 TaxID=2819191 RepID=UPI002034E266|nr:hypothetical protein [Streptomyces sp. ISL-96]